MKYIRYWTPQNLSGFLRAEIKKIELKSVSPLDRQTVRFVQVFLYPLSIAETSPETVLRSSVRWAEVFFY